MALIVKDRVKETTTTTGTGTITLAGAVASFQSFAAIGNGNSTYYAIESNNDYEVGLGTYTASGTTLSRDTVLESSNSGSKITLAGTSDVFCTYPAEKAAVLDANDNLTLSNNAVINGLTVGKGANSVANNTAFGDDALDAAVTGDNNVAIGKSALTTNTSGTNNVAVGINAGAANTTGGYNVFVGRNARDANTTASNNTALGNRALGANTTAASNTAIGADALLANTTASNILL